MKPMKSMKQKDSKQTNLVPTNHPHIFYTPEGDKIYQTDNHFAYLFFDENILDDFMTQRLEDIINAQFAQGCDIAFMPDSHPTSSCMVGTTIKLKDKVDVNYVSADIGCGVSYLKLSRKLTNEDFKKIDEVILNNHVDWLFHETPLAHFVYYDDLICKDSINKDLADRALVTVGGGNHFIEVDNDEQGNDYLVIHSGSRNLGGQVHKHYERIQKQQSKNNHVNTQAVIKDIVGILKKHNLAYKIEPIIKEIVKDTNAKNAHLNNYLSGLEFEHYLHDLNVVNEYAKLNRISMMRLILNAIGLNNDLLVDGSNVKHSIHNIVGADLVLRKGTISAKAGQEVIVPINMAEGSLIGIAKGLKHWNDSCPHGAGRLFSRSKAKNTFTLEQFKDATKNLYSSCINLDTIDESPMAYKSLAEILKNTTNMDVIHTLHSRYNFKKASEDNVAFFKTMRAKKKVAKQEEEKSAKNDKQTNKQTNNQSEQHYESKSITRR